MSRPFTMRAAFLAACGALWTVPAAAQNSPPNPAASLATLYESQNDAVDKAKAFPKFGEALFESIRKDVEAGQYPAALVKLEDYIARARAMRMELKAAVPNPEKKPNGFKQLQIHLRKVIRTLNHTIVSLPLPERAPFLAGRRDIENIDRELISDLFPRQPGRKTPDPKEKEKP